MRSQIFVVLCLGVAFQGFGQTSAPAAPALPKAPRAIIDAAAPFYDFTDPALKPWHLKAAYQLYDEKGDPTEQGTYEYWWVSPKLYRSTWRRPGATHTDWHTADGKHAYQSTGEPLKYFENKLQSALLSPLPTSDDLDPGNVHLELKALASAGTKFPCIMLVPNMPPRFGSDNIALGLFPTYCFDPQLPVLRASTSMGSFEILFDKIVKIQGKFLAREVGFYQGKYKILSATVDTVEGIAPSNAALTPPADAQIEKVGKVDLSSAVAVGSLNKKQMPVYPQDAKDAHVSGTVILRAVIGRDGSIYDLHVVSAPWPSLAASALWAVSHWEYKPYLLNGEPVEVETTVNVIYSLGR